MKKKIKDQTQTLQIIGGEYRHRKITFISAQDLRPTGARVRETLFNWLQTAIVGANCLDLFAGSGILGLEALSRGAKTVTFIEKNPQSYRQLKHNIAQLNIVHAAVHLTDAIAVLNQYIPAEAQTSSSEKQKGIECVGQNRTKVGDVPARLKAIDILFLDPPYTLRLLPELLRLSEKLKPKWIFIEDNQPFEQWVVEETPYRVVKSKKAGGIYYGLLTLPKT